MTVLLTAVLVWVTRQYTNATRGQLAELREGRLTSLRPYLHVGGVPKMHEGSADAPVNALRIGFHVECINVGLGPALDLRSRTANPVLVFKPDALRSVLPAGNGFSVEVVTSPEETPGGVTGTVPAWDIVDIEVRYRDLADRHWLTGFQVKLELKHMPPDWQCTAIRLVPESEHVTEEGA